uniref:Uncharacterized protein n=1 Tax=Candidatus Kentrum sp. LPFa TaxID=2126335 RepID=A0A450XTA5_9GAMM|nr:MAG: hypothetical protein BECKLPF1236A_GA0070988_101856 [Candidatus Kentron sp. LPFa]VFK32478.1 MAG: hypothetical protein BECKLPF1236C_GA0070990_101682 [Candidatus Kentron sp. LPFa]
MAKLYIETSIISYLTAPAPWIDYWQSHCRRLAKGDYGLVGNSNRPIFLVPLGAGIEEASRGNSKAVNMLAVVEGIEVLPLRKRREIPREPQPYRRTHVETRSRQGKITYLKLWLGVMIAVEVILTGWLLTNFLLTHWLFLLAGVLALPIIGLGVYILHTRIEAKIAGLEEL